MEVAKKCNKIIVLDQNLQVYHPTFVVYNLLNNMFSSKKYKDAMRNFVVDYLYFILGSCVYDTKIQIQNRKTKTKLGQIQTLTSLKPSVEI